MLEGYQFIQLFFLVKELLTCTVGIFFMRKNALYNFRNEDPEDLTEIVSLSKSIKERVSLKVNQCHMFMNSKI